MTLESQLREEIKWFGHASFSITDAINKSKIYFLDPFDLKDVKEKADIIFITHLHHDHCSPEDVKKVLKPDTVIVTVPGEIEKMKLPNQLMHTKPGMDFSVKGIRIKTVPAYNIKPERLKFHPKGNNWVGYILFVNGKSIYHAGDTDFIPEMNELAKEKLTVAMLPIGGTYTMNVEDAIAAANAIKAEITMPMHYKRLLGEKHKEAEKRFIEGVNGKALILDDLGEGHH